jgi:hypothetical protein
MERARIARTTDVLQDADIAGFTRAVAAVDDGHVVQSKVQGAPRRERVDALYVADSA